MSFNKYSTRQASVYSLFICGWKMGAAKLETHDFCWSIQNVGIFGGSVLLSKKVRRGHKREQVGTVCFHPSVLGEPEKQILYSQGTRKWSVFKSTK